MATWKERGEVPDSEDEFAYDNDGGEDLTIPPERPSTPGKDANSAPAAPKQDIWDLPASSLEPIAVPQATGRPSTPPGQPNYSLSSSPLSDPPSDISSVPGESSSPERRRFRIAKVDGREFSPDPLANDLAPGPGSIPSAPAAGPTGRPGAGPTASPTVALKTTSSGRIDTEKQSRDDEDEGLPIASLFGARNPSDNPVTDAAPPVPDEHEQGLTPRVRRFRPRKPIQEHPYALENARYSNTFRSHGLKPLRLEAVSEPRTRRRVAEEDSQEKEFEDDSQETGDADDDALEAVHDPLLSLSDESQQDVQIDEWRFRRSSLPSTPTTSLPQHRGRPISQLGSAETQRTSIDGDADQEEFPSLEELVKAPLPQTSSSKSTKSTKRKSLSTSSSRKKRLKTRQTTGHQQDSILDDVSRLSPSRPSPPPRQPSPTDLPRLIFPDDLSLSPPSSTRTREESRPRNPSPPAPAPTPNVEPVHEEPVDLTVELDDSSVNESTNSSSEPDDEDTAAIMRAARRRRGVLPPSYLRLDEKDAKRGRRRPNLARRPLGSPDKLQRKGVARHKIPSGDVAPTRFEVFEDSDEDIASQPPQVDDSPGPMRQTTLVIEADEDDENESAIEDNRIDPMLPKKKRQSSRSAKPWPVKRMKAAGRTALQTTQPKTTSHFPGLDGNRPQAAGKPGATGQSGVRTKSQKQRTGRVKPRRNKSVQRRDPVPRLSILDVIEPDAPKFLRVAARSARHHKDLGRSSPSNKIFQMATRWDHVDVNTVIQRWKGGHLKPRLAPDAKPRTPKAKEPVPSAPRPAGLSVRQWPITKQRKLVKQVSAGGRVTYEAPAGTDSPAAGGTIPSQRHGETFSTLPDRPFYRPAQLETKSTEPAKYSFHAKKRALDNLWRNSLRGRQSATPSVVSRFRQNSQALRSPSPPPPECIQPAPAKPAALTGPYPDRERRKSKFRKNFVPKPLDVSAPQFSPTDEPLPAFTFNSVEDPADLAEPLPEANKLTGLAPYGTQYTHHFEIFPLDSDVFFHESTLLGSGRIDKATSCWDNERLSRQRTRISFTLDGKPLRWGQWDEQVSSELGILMDWLSDRVQEDQDTTDPPRTAAALQAANFVLSYVQDSMSLPDSIAEQSFAYRIIETMRSFLERFKNDKHPFKSSVEPGIIDVLCRILVVVFTCNHICRKSSHLVDVRMAMEDLLMQASRITAHALLSNGVDVVQKFLQDSREVSFRQRGIRPSHVVIHTWVVLMRVLEVANIPRSGFWDIVNSVLIPQDINSETNSGTMEKLWRTMFTLLPLREFDSRGVIVPGIRRLVSMDGWSLPQRLIKRVFDLYKQNHRQAASFNDYCRALISRCHYLAREWGWSNCRGIIGTIFDFFGSQHLYHLRNEEAYKSPRFLEELARNPSLVVEREDRCFHIFLKFVALVIKRLREREASKEIRNLIARVVPNHSRDYPKDRPLYAHDLASLRNHHDLLCTLFWAAPRDLRPEVHLIEALIRPADTHKDACLVNLRAWNQLSRYIVSTENDGAILRVFHQWQCNIFRQLMDQFESAASDAQQQYLALSEEDSQGISQTRFEFVVSMNKATAKEIINACVNASRDVLPYSRNFPAATFALNTLQMGEVLRHFSISPPTLDWAILRSVLETLNTYLFKIDALFRQQECRDSGADDVESMAMTCLHRELARSLFAAARCIIATEGTETKSATAETDRSMCVELITVLAARLFTGFSKAGLVDASQALGPGIYSLFGREVHKLPLGHRKHLVLFVATLLKRGLLGVESLGPSLIELWLLALVKPRRFLAYENQLAGELKRRNEPFVPEAVVGLSIDPDYGSNRDLFECKSRTPHRREWHCRKLTSPEDAISWMRQSLRDAAPGTRRDIVSAFSTALRTVMDQIKSDLRVVALDPVEHPPYVAFVRDIISLIRSHVTEICVVDDFFYQISKEYSPSLQDPRLHVAGIIAYGVRLGEGEAQVAPQLFYYLFNNFKNALINDKLKDEVRMLRRGMTNHHILAFVLRKMVPAISKAAVRVSGVFPLLDVYHDALARLLTGHIAGRGLTEESLPDVLSLVQTIMASLDKLDAGGITASSAEQLHVARQLCRVVNMLWPSLEELSYTDRPKEPLRVLEHSLGRLQGWLDSTVSGLDNALATRQNVTGQNDMPSGLRGIADSLPQPEPEVTRFQDWIITDVGKNWVISDSTITIQAPARARGPSSTPSAQGIKKPEWNVFDLMESLNEELKFWRLRQSEIFPGKRVAGRRIGKGSITNGLIF